MPYAFKMSFFKETFSIDTRPGEGRMELTPPADRVGLIDATSNPGVCAPAANATSDNSSSFFIVHRASRMVITLSALRRLTGSHGNESNVSLERSIAGHGGDIYATILPYMH